MKVEMDGKPTPSASFQWLHEGNKVQTIKGKRLYPNIYQSTYALDNIPASYCGRVLVTRASNSLGKSVRKSTTVTVLRKLNVINFSRLMTWSISFILQFHWIKSTYSLYLLAMPEEYYKYSCIQEYELNVSLVSSYSFSKYT